METPKRSQSLYVLNISVAGLKWKRKMFDLGGLNAPCLSAFTTYQATVAQQAVAVNLMNAAQLKAIV